MKPDWSRDATSYVEDMSLDDIRRDLDRLGAGAYELLSEDDRRLWIALTRREVELLGLTAE